MPVSDTDTPILFKIPGSDTPYSETSNTKTQKNVIFMRKKANPPLPIPRPPPINLSYPLSQLTTRVVWVGIAFFLMKMTGFFVEKGEYNAIFFVFLFRYFFLYPIVSDYQKSKFGGPIFELPILLKSNILILFSVSDKYGISEDR
jgi:hypothetical protein